MSRLRTGDVIDGRYRIEALIGSGGMADVWLADDQHLPRRVALKVLHDRFARDPEFIERFRREAESAARLQHVNIVSIFDRGQVGDTYYIAMSYLDGRTLRDLINLGLTPQESVAIVRQILEAAGFAHRHGVIHRDLKPLNVIVDATGLATVTDFGIARAGGVSDLTEQGSIMGTAHYLSPEQAQGLEVGPESDLYSVGVVLYECLTGQVPYTGDSAVAIAMRQMSETPYPPSAYNDSVSPALDAVVMKALEREPIARYRSAEAFIEALDLAESDPMAGYVEPERPSKKWMWFAAIGAILVALLLWGALRTNTVEVPKVVGQNVDQAISELNKDGFSIGQVERKQQSGPINLVLQQNPSGTADQDCFLGFFCSDPDVDLVVSAGPGTAEVPDVTGENRTTAEQNLVEAGFGVSVETKASSDVGVDNVIETDPAAGESVKRGTQITMFVSSGPQQVAVPPVVGELENAARQQLSAKGLSMSTSTEASDRPEGEVLDQSPDAGEKVDPDSTVEVTVSSGPAETTVSVPNVVGLTEAEAKSDLNAAGLVASVQDQSTSIQPQDGRVIDQNPGAGGDVNEGTRIVIIVGSYDPNASADDSSSSGGLGVN
ncbi:MAG: PASTA domain-containing protein [Solirubrobacterales bacterium]